MGLQGGSATGTNFACAVTCKRELRDAQRCAVHKGQPDHTRIFVTPPAIHRLNILVSSLLVLFNMTVLAKALAALEICPRHL